MIASAAAYLALVSLFLLCGLGTQRLLRVGLVRDLRWLLAPVFAQAVLACLLGGAVALGVAPLKTPAPVIWLALGLLAIVGLADIWTSRREPPLVTRARIGLGLALVLALLLPFVTMWPYLASGLGDYRGSGLSDGWAYVAAGQSYWDHVRGTARAGALLYEYGASLAEVRFVASAQLPFLASVFRPGGAQGAFGLLQACGLFTTLAACAAFASARRAPMALSTLYLMICGASGWFADVIWANNLDHLLALGYMPALFACLEAPGTLASKRAPIAVLVAGLLYTYPEVAWFPLAGALAWAWLRRRGPADGDGREHEPWWPTAWRVGAWAALIVLPYLPTMLGFVWRQASNSVAGGRIRSGFGMLPGLVDPRWAWTAVWGLGGEHRFAAAPWPWGDALAAAGLLVLLALGLAWLLRTRQHGLAAVALGSVLLALGFGAGMRYAYGTYKILLSGWWLCAWVIVVGAAAPLARSRRPVAYLATAAGVLILLAVPASVLARNAALPAQPATFQLRRVVSMAPFRALRETAALVNGAPIGLFFEDFESAYWAAYYLRDLRLRAPAPGGYLASRKLRDRLARVPLAPWRDVRFILTDSSQPVQPEVPWRHVWSGGGHDLWDVGERPWVAAAQVSTPNGAERLGGHSFFWMGGGATRLLIVAGESGTLALTGDFQPGPSGPAHPDRRVRVSNGRGDVSNLRVSPGPQTILIPVAAGPNILKISPLDRVERPELPNGDPRPLLLGVRALRAALRPDAAGAASRIAIVPAPQHANAAGPLTVAPAGQ